MSERRTGHEQFRNLFAREQQTGVRVAGTNQGGNRSRASNKDASRTASRRKDHGPSKSGKSVKKTTSGQRPKTPSNKKSSGSRKKASAISQSPISQGQNDSSRGTSKTPRTATTPTSLTAHTAHTPGSTPVTPKKKASTGAPPPKGQQVQEKTEMCPTVFENDVTAGAATTTTGGGQVHMAEAKIKERKLQWKKEDKDKLSPVKTDPRQEASGSHHDDPDKDYGKQEKKEEARHEANNTIRERTIFENDDAVPAAVKEEKPKLQWAPGAQPTAAHESMSEPMVRKKKTGDEPRSALSERPPRGDPPMKPPRGVPVVPGKLIPLLPGAAGSPGGRLDYASNGQSTNATSITGSIEGKDKEDAAEKMVSCYIAPTLQKAEFNSAELIKKAAVDSEPYEGPRK